MICIGFDFSWLHFGLVDWLIRLCVICWLIVKSVLEVDGLIYRTIDSLVFDFLLVESAELSSGFRPAEDHPPARWLGG